MHLKDGFEINNNPHKCNKIRSIRRDGFEVKVFKVCETDSENEAYDVEASFIAKFGYGENGVLTNLVADSRPPSRKGATISEEQRAAVSKANKGKNKGKSYKEMYGDLADSVKAKIGQASRERAPNITQATKDKISKANSRSYIEIYGSEEEAKRQALIRSQARSGKKRTLEQRALMHKNSGVRDKPAWNRTPVTLNGIEYPSMTVAAKAFGCGIDTLKRRIKAGKIPHLPDEGQMEGMYPQLKGMQCEVDTEE